MKSPRQRAIAEFVLDHLVWFMLAVVLIVFSIFVPNFFQIGIFANIIEQSTFVGVMAIGLAIVIIAGHMDLSVESTAALAAMVDRHTVLLARHRHGHHAHAGMAGAAGVAADRARRRRADRLPQRLLHHQARR